MFTLLSAFAHAKIKSWTTRLFINCAGGKPNKADEKRVMFSTAKIDIFMFYANFFTLFLELFFHSMGKRDMMFNIISV